MRRTGNAFTLVELLVVLAIIAVLIGLLLPAIQKVRETAAWAGCQSNLRQLGLGMHVYHNVNGYLPSGMGSLPSGNGGDNATAFILLLPYIEQANLAQMFNPNNNWFDKPNYQAVAVQVKLFYCPSNRSEGSMNLTSIAAEWNCPLPPTVASCDYALCMGATNAPIWWAFQAADNHNAAVPPNLVGALGVFGANPAGGMSWDGPNLVLTGVTDGTSMTIAMGDAAGGNAYYLARDLTNPQQPAIDATTGQPAIIDQSWSAASIGDTTHAWYGSLFAVTAQYGIAPNPMDEPMNRRPCTPTARDTNHGANAGQDPVFGGVNVNYVSGFRSMHPNGCNFVFCDGSVHFINQSIDASTYRALSTYAGGEVVSDMGF